MRMTLKQLRAIVCEEIASNKKNGLHDPTYKVYSKSETGPVKTRVDGDLYRSDDDTEFEPDEQVIVEPHGSKLKVTRVSDPDLSYSQVWSKA